MLSFGQGKESRQQTSTLLPLSYPAAKPERTSTMPTEVLAVPLGVNTIRD